MDVIFKNAHNYLYLYGHTDKFNFLFRGDVRRICDFFGVNRSTAYRWIKAGKPTNETALRLLDIAAAGFLPCNRAWDKYFIFNGHLVTHSGYVLAPWQIDRLCQASDLQPTAERLTDNQRNYAPWRDRQPKFVKNNIPAANSGPILKSCG